MDLDGSGGDGEHTQPRTTLHTHEGAIVEHLDKEGGREEREEGKRWRRGKGGGWKGGKERRRDSIIPFFLQILFTSLFLIDMCEYC